MKTTYKGKLNGVEVVIETEEENYAAIIARTQSLQKAGLQSFSGNLKKETFEKKNRCNQYIGKDPATEQAIFCHKDVDPESAATCDKIFKDEFHHLHPKMFYMSKKNPGEKVQKYYCKECLGKLLNPDPLPDVDFS